MTSIILKALSAFFLTEALRTLAPEAWRDKKPLACAFCMAFHTNTLMWATDYVLGLPPWPYGSLVASMGATYALLRFFERPFIDLGDDE